MTNKDNKIITLDPQSVQKALAGKDFTHFATTLEPSLSLTPFHESYYAVLDAFARGDIRRIMISIPPQHGKSFAASRLLPAYMLGRDPSLRIALCSYSFALARKFGQGVRGVIGSPKYAEIFPDTYLKGANGTSKNDSALLTAEEFDCVGKGGGMKLVGRECSLTGNRVDVMILDDLYKDALEANSPTVRENTWDWYTSVVRTRMHNLSQEIVVFTRWHQADLIGRISQHERVVELTSLEQLTNIPPRVWVKINFEALKESPATLLDPRGMGEPLWPERHSRELLQERREMDPKVFEALYQGNPQSREGLLYGEFATYGALPQNIIAVAAQVDTADTGGDFLCGIAYHLDGEGFVYVVDVVYSDAPMEVTEGLVAGMIERTGVSRARFESNNGGRGFARAVGSLLAQKGKRVEIMTYHQGHSKEARILSNATAVMRRVRMPQDWQERWGRFATDLREFKLNFHSNLHDDAPDALTAIIEQVMDAEGQRQGHAKRIRSLSFIAR